MSSRVYFHFLDTDLAFLVQRSPSSRRLRLIAHLPGCFLLQGFEWFPLLLSPSFLVSLYSRIFLVERGQSPDYVMSFLELSCKVMVVIMVTLLENFRGFQLAHPLLAHSLLAQSLLPHLYWSVLCWILFSWLIFLKINVFCRF